MELHIDIPQNHLVYFDNLSSKALAQNLVFHTHTKHIKIYHHFLRDLVMHNKLDI